VPRRVTPPKWLADAARQLDAAVEEDPKGRSAGVLIVRALIRKAIKGDVRAMQECLALAKNSAKDAAREPPPRRRAGRPLRHVDLVEIQRLARMGMSDLSKVGRCLGVPKQTLLGPAHVEAVKDAFETGRAMFERDALQEYADDIAHNWRNPLVIFKMKQLNWTDRQAVTSGGLPDVTGARDRLRALIEKKRALGGGQ